MSDSLATKSAVPIFLGTDSAPLSPEIYMNLRGRMVIAYAGSHYVHLSGGEYLNLETTPPK